MKYTKPEIKVTSTATLAIQGSKGIGAHDNPDMNPIKTTAAYEADE